MTGANIGNELGLSGIIWALGGFAVTAWQLIRTNNASQAAKAAVNKLELRLRAFEDDQICRDCLSACAEIQRLHIAVGGGRDSAVVALLPDRYTTLRLTVYDLRHRLDGTLNELQQTAMQSAISKLNDAERSVKAKIRNRNMPMPNLRPLESAISSLSEVLTTLSVELDRRAIGGNNAR